MCVCVCVVIILHGLMIQPLDVYFISFSLYPSLEIELDLSFIYAHYIIKMWVKYSRRTHVHQHRERDNASRAYNMRVRVVIPI